MRREQRAAHEDSVWSVAWRGGKVLTGSLDATVKVWAADQLAEEGVLAGHTLGVVQVAISKDGACKRSFLHTACGA